MHQELKLHMLSSRGTTNLLNYTYKATNGLAAGHLCERLKNVKDRATYATRSTGTMKLMILSVRLESSKHNFFYCGSVSWNELNDDIKRFPSYDSFKWKI